MLLLSRILNKYLHSTLQFAKYCPMHYFIVSFGRLMGLVSLPCRLADGKVMGSGVKQTQVQIPSVV